MLNVGKRLWVEDSAFLRTQSISPKSATLNFYEPIVNGGAIRPVGLLFVRGGGGGR